MPIANVIGSSIGKSAAYVAHAAINSGVGTGRFASDVVSATATGYSTKAEELSARRTAVLALRQTPVKVVINRKPRVAA